MYSTVTYTYTVHILLSEFVLWEKRLTKESVIVNDISLRTTT